MLTDNKKIAIVGGGPGGITLTRLLQLKGVDVTLYERDINSNARLIGSPLDMHESSGMAALRKAGLVEAFEKKYRAGADRKVVVNEQAEVFFSDHNTDREGGTEPGSINPEIDRASLRKIFLDSLQPGTIVWDSHFISMEEKDAGWLLHFKNGTSAFADIVIAADGANSRIRRFLTPIKSFYVGVTMVEINIPAAATTVPAIHRLLKGGKVMAFGNGKCILGGQKGDDDLGFYTSFKPAEDWATHGGIDFSNRQQLLDWFTHEYAGWSSAWYELIKHASLPVIPRPIYCMPLNQDWAALPNLTMMGDAAHVMPPFAGEGANTAMQDALELSECLTSADFSSTQEAIAFYENRMRKRASAAARMSLDNGERMHSDGALDKMLAIFNAAKA